MLQEEISSNDEIDLGKLFDAIWAGKWIILVFTATCTFASIMYALSLPDIYRSSVLLAPSNDSKGGGMSALAGQFGGLASLAGVNLGGSGNDTVNFAIEVIKSRQFIYGLIEKYDMLVPLIAAKGWNRNENKLIYDTKIYDEANQKWIESAVKNKSSSPSLQEGYESLRKRLTVFQDKETNFVSISIEFYSPGVAKEWVDIIVKGINQTIKQKHVEEAQRSIKYLNNQVEKTFIADMKSIFYELIEEQSKVIMLAEVRSGYVFSTIDVAVIPEVKYGPKRSLIVVLAVLGSLFFGLVVALILNFRNQNSSSS